MASATGNADPEPDPDPDRFGTESSLTTPRTDDSGRVAVVSVLVDVAGGDGRGNIPGGFPHPGGGAVIPTAVAVAVVDDFVVLMAGLPHPGGGILIPVDSVEEATIGTAAGGFAHPGSGFDTLEGASFVSAGLGTDFCIFVDPAGTCLVGCGCVCFGFDCND